MLESNREMCRYLMKKNCGYLATRKPRQRNRFLAISGHMLELNTEICLYLIYKNCGNLATRKPPPKKKQIFSHFWSHARMEWKNLSIFNKKNCGNLATRKPPKKTDF